MTVHERDMETAAANRTTKLLTPPPPHHLTSSCPVPVHEISPYSPEYNTPFHAKTSRKRMGEFSRGCMPTGVTFSLF